MGLPGLREATPYSRVLFFLFSSINGNCEQIKAAEEIPGAEGEDIRGMEAASGAGRNPRGGPGPGRTWSGDSRGRSTNSGDHQPSRVRLFAGKRQIPPHQREAQKGRGGTMTNGRLLPSAAAASPPRTRTRADRGNRSSTPRGKFFTSWLRQIVCPAVMFSRSPADADRGEGAPRGRKWVCKRGGRRREGGAVTGL